MRNTRVIDSRSVIDMRAALLLVLVGCATEGERTPPPDPMFHGAVETEQFLPLLCTGGMPNSATCPWNIVTFDTWDVDGRVRFVAQTVGGGLYLNDMTWIAGPEGMHLEYPSLRVGAQLFNIASVIDVPPNGEVTTTTMAITSFSATSKMAFRFDLKI